MSFDARLEAATTEYQRLQKELTNAIEARQRLDSQLQENEFKLLKEDANIYKLIGPVLIKQDKIEATSNVDKRLDYIRSEIKRVETQLADLSEKSEKKKFEVVDLQRTYQAQVQQVSSSR
ncbi:6445_t:CDS:2 [Funneliformis geosporum]|uniref:6445_t:CDS:1 n=1 Tax=Funneliformis geosporum TaxID=1117311 RepID=A0A9W4WRW4_9GLOM|nr:6445_t:CDS:2 [Funneliformis geosporum]